MNLREKRLEELIKVTRKEFHARIYLYFVIGNLFTKFTLFPTIFEKKFIKYIFDFSTLNLTPNFSHIDYI